MEKQRAKELIDSVRSEPQTRAQRAQKAVLLCQSLLNLTLQNTDKKEKKNLEKLAKMMDDTEGKIFTTEMTDQCFRSKSTKRTANQLVYLLSSFGIPKYLSFVERLKLTAFRILGPLVPFILVPLAQKSLRKELSKVILPEEEQQLQRYFQKAKERGVRLNINHLGEAILGEQETLRRLKIYLADLKNPLVETISIKISTIYSQINPVAFDETLRTLSERLRLLYQAALDHPYTRPDGTILPKFINLDMEEYKDLDFTVELFQKVLSEEPFFHLQAGIVLQSYVPDSFEAQQRLTDWAKERLKKGGAPIKIRIVKGANLEMEKVESSLRGWAIPTFHEKKGADANFKRMVEYGFQKENAVAVHIGIGSHNLFDISFCLLLRSEQCVEKEITFEMLAGMAEPMQRAVHAVSGTMLLYCPEAKEQAFQNAVAYLIRRLDENTGPKNFLRHLFDLNVHSPHYESQKNYFLTSCQALEMEVPKRNREQNRLKKPAQKNQNAPFHNEPDTDFSLEENRAWAQHIYAEWKNKTHPDIPLVIGGTEMTGQKANGFDPSRPGQTLYNYSLASIDMTDKALNVAHEKQVSWGGASVEKRSQLLAAAATLFREKRGELIGVMMGDGGKILTEADVEVSETIDFCDYYRVNFEKINAFSDVSWLPKGPILVAPPWNFPLAIPAGGIAAALMAGNTVIFKPAPETVLTGWHIASIFWEAGVEREVLQFINGPDDSVGSHIIKHPKLKGVILTGATSTAHHLLKLNPALDLMAETGGKNALIATALCDRDLAAKDAVHSAFFHAGQKCSACSLLILEKELYDCPTFLQQIKDAAQSLPVGSAWDKNTAITPLIRPPEGALARALTSLDKGESWLLEPKQDPDNPALYSPGIKLGVKKGSYSHQTEFFGPVLSIMRAKNLKEAIHIANATSYGLTSGLHSLDVREQTVWKKRIVAGNLYINRGITGAIVRRQPFGGCKASGFGSGAKAGGPNYVIELCHPKQMALPKHQEHKIPSWMAPLPLSSEEKQTLKASLASYAYWAPILKEPIDPSSLIGQDNLFYHVPREGITLRVHAQDPLLNILQVVMAAQFCAMPLEVSSELSLQNVPNLSHTQEDDLTFLRQVENGKFSRIRLLNSPSQALQKVAAESATYLIHAPVLANGRFELLHYLREVSVSHDYHRYGNLGRRTDSH